MNKVLVLGADGFTGRNFIAWVRNNESINNHNQFIGASINSTPVAGYDQWIKVDITDCNSYEEVFGYFKPNYVINLAGILRAPSYSVLHAINAEASLSLMNFFLKLGSVRKMLLIGSAAEYGNPVKLPLEENVSCNPLNLYGLSKLCQTMYVEYFTRQQHFPVCIARTFNIIGPGMPNNLAIGAFREKIIKANDGEVITTGDLNAKRDYLVIDDVCSAYWGLLKAENAPMLCNVCSGVAVSMKEILDVMISASGKKLTIEQNNCLTTTGKDVPEIYGDNRLLKSVTGWSQCDNVLDAASDIIKKELEKLQEK